MPLYHVRRYVRMAGDINVWACDEEEAIRMADLIECEEYVDDEFAVEEENENDVLEDEILNPEDKEG